MKSGEIYRGLLLSAEDTMNVSLSEVIRTAQNGKITKLPNVYLRGSGIRFIALPDLLKNAPCFQKVQTMKRKMEEAQAQREGECHMLMFRLFPEIFFVGLQRRYLMLLLRFSCVRSPSAWSKMARSRRTASWSTARITASGRWQRSCCSV